MRRGTGAGVVLPSLASLAAWRLLFDRDGDRRKEAAVTPTTASSQGPWKVNRVLLSSQNLLSESGDPVEPGFRDSQVWRFRPTCPDPDCKVVLLHPIFGGGFQEVPLERRGRGLVGMAAHLTAGTCEVGEVRNGYRDSYEVHLRITSASGGGLRND